MDGGSIVPTELSPTSFATALGARNSQIAVDSLSVFLEAERSHLPRVGVFLVESLNNIARNWEPLGRKAAKVRRREINQKCKIGSKIVSARVHFINEFVWQLQYRNGHRFYYDQPFMSQADAVYFASKLLILVGLEKRTYRPPPGITLSDKALLEENAETVFVKVRRSYRNWNCRQLPNCPRGVYSSISKNINANPREIAKSQRKLTIHDLNLKKKGNNSSPVNLVKRQK